MTTVSRVNQVSHSNVTGAPDWDHRLNRLLEDLQETVIPSETQLGGANEYREFRMTQRTQVNDEPAQQIDEKWVEYGTQSGGQTLPLTGSSNFGSGGGSGTTRYGEKSVAFSDDLTSTSSSRYKEPQIEFLAPANSTTILKSGPSSPTPLGTTYTTTTSSTSPKVERKEFYAKASYTTLIKGGPGDISGISPLSTDDNRAERILEDLIPTDFRAPPTNTPRLQSSSTTTSETKRTYMESSRDTNLGQPLYSSTPIKPPTATTREYSRDFITDTGRSVTPPPKPTEALKTPPMIRKILQSSQQQQQQSSSLTSYKQSTTQHSTTSSSSATSGRPPVGGVPLPILRDTGLRDRGNYDDPPERKAANYYTSTTTTEHRTDREMSPVKRFPSPHPPKGGDNEPPKRLDELLATFGDTSYSESSTTRYGGDGPGPHKSIPYGPGTHSVQPLRSVRIDDNVQHRQIEDDSELIQRKNVSRSETDGTRNVAGPPVYFPPGQIFQKTEEEALMASQEGGKGKGKMKMKREYKEKEKMKSKHSEKGGGGAVPVPVCLPVCCAAPCVIM